MSIALLQEKIRARKTPLALVLGPEADKLPARITKNFTDMYGPGDMAQAEALRYHGSQLISQTAPLLPAVVLRFPRCVPRRRARRRPSRPRGTRQ